MEILEHMRKLILSVLFSAPCRAFFFQKHPLARAFGGMVKSGIVFLFRIPARFEVAHHRGLSPSGPIHCRDPFRADASPVLARRSIDRRNACLKCASLALVLIVTIPGAVTGAQELDKTAADFHFTNVDNQVLQNSKAIDQQYLKKGLVMQDPQLQAYFDSIGKSIIGNRPIPDQVEFKFMVLRDPMVQAFALPNGSVYVTTGLLSLLEDEAQLAAVLGHETAHVFERHGYLENRSIRKKAVTLNILEIAASAAPSLRLGENHRKEAWQAWKARNSLKLHGDALTLKGQFCGTLRTFVQI